MNAAERRRFDALLEQVVASLPEQLRSLLEEAPLIVEDHPSPRLLAELGIDEATESLCGLHSGVPLTERSVMQSHGLPETIHLFREGIIDEAGGWERWADDDGERWGGDDAVAEQIRITLLHEIGHHFGLEEEDLADLGYE